MLIWLILYSPENYVDIICLSKDFAGRGAQNMKAMRSFMLSIFLQ